MCVLTSVYMCMHMHASVTLPYQFSAVVQVTGKFRGAHNPYDMGCVKNCSAVLCAPKKPRYMHYRIKPYYPLRESRRPEMGGANTMLGRGSPQTGVGSAPINDLRCMPVYEELDNHASVHAAAQNVCG